MVSDIRVEFEEILKNVDWMDEKTRINALEKAKSMSTHIAYPDELLDNRKLEEFYDGVSSLQYVVYFFVCNNKGNGIRIQTDKLLSVIISHLDKLNTKIENIK